MLPFQYSSLRNWPVRITYFTGCIVITAFALNFFASLIQHLISIRYGWEFELCMVLGQMLFQLPFIWKQKPAIKQAYIYHLLTVSAIGSISLLPLLAWNYFIAPLGEWWNLGYFFSVVAYMFFNHKGRVKRLRLPIFICYTWVCYRFLILLYIL